MEPFPLLHRCVVVTRGGKGSPDPSPGPRRVTRPVTVVPIHEQSAPGERDSLYVSRKRLKTLSTMREMSLSKSLWGRLPQKVIEPTEKTAPPFGASK